MKRLHAATMAVLIAAPLSLTTGGAGASPPGSAWHSAVSFTNVVASSPTTGGGYPVPLGARVPVAGTCGAGPFNANHSESWGAGKAGGGNHVGPEDVLLDKE